MPETLFELEDSTTGAPVRVTQTEAEAGLRSGALRTYQPLPALDPRGTAGTLAPDRIADALAAGYRLDTPEARARRQYQAEHPVETQVVNPAVVAASGVLREGTLQASQLGEEALGVRGEIDRLREENPTAAQIGDLGGMVLPALLTGGTSTEASLGSQIARGATAPGRLVLGAGERVGAGLTRALAGGAESGVARRILARAAGGAVEGAIQTTGSEVGHIATEEALGEDPGDIADRLITSAGLGAVLGGGLHAGGGILGEGSRAARARAGDLSDLIARQYAQQTGRALPQGMGELMADVVSRGSAAVRGESPALSRRFLGEGGRDALRILEQGDGAIDEASAGLRGSLDRMLGRARHVSEEMLGEAKVDSLERVMGGDVVDQRALAQSMLERAERLRAEIGSDMEQFNGVTYGRSAGSARRRLEGYIARARDRIERAIMTTDGAAREGAEMFAALDQLKRDVGGIRREMERGGGTTFGRDAFNGLYQDLRSPLERADVWGDGAAALQRDSNRGWAQFIPWDNDVDRMLLRAGEPLEGDFGRAPMANSAAVRNFVGALGSESNATAETVFRNWLDGMEARNAAALEHHTLSGEARADAEALSAEIRSVREQLSRASHVTETLEAGRQLGRGNSGIAGLAAAVAGGAGSLGLAAPLAAFAALSNPVRIAQTLAVVQRLAGQADQRIGAAVRSFLSSARRTATISVGEAPRALRGAFTVEAYRERVAQLDRDRDRAQLAQRIGQSTRELSRAAPRVQGAVALRASRAASFLDSVRPRGADASIFPGQHRQLPSRAEMDRFMRYARAVDDPGTVIDDIKEGRVTREGMQAVREVYPALYARLTRELMQQIAEGGPGAMSYQDRIQIGTILGQPVDPTMRAPFMAMLQSATTPTQAPPQQAAAQGQAPDLSGQMASEADRLSARLAT